MVFKRFVPLVLGVTLMLYGCGNGEVSLDEYAERVNDAVNRATQQYEVLIESGQGAVMVAEGAQLTAFSPQDLQAALEQLGEIEAELSETTDAIAPPEEVADLHKLLFDTRFASAREALAARAGTSVDWEELSETREMAAYRTAVAEDKQACIDIQGELDDTEEREVFADAPWIPGELKEVVDSVLGCAAFPDHPEDLFRPPPTSLP